MHVADFTSNFVLRIITDLVQNNQIICDLTIFARRLRMRGLGSESSEVANQKTQPFKASQKVIRLPTQDLSM